MTCGSDWSSLVESSIPPLMGENRVPFCHSSTALKKILTLFHCSARGLFSLGVITLSGSMSVMISYDKTAVSEADAALFTKTFDEGLRKVKDSVGKISILQARS